LCGKTEKISDFFFKNQATRIFSLKGIYVKIICIFVEPNVLHAK